MKWFIALVVLIAASPAWSQQTGTWVGVHVQKDWSFVSSNIINELTGAVEDNCNDWTIPYSPWLGGGFNWSLADCQCSWSGHTSDVLAQTLSYVSTSQTADPKCTAQLGVAMLLETNWLSEDRCRITGKCIGFSEGLCMYAWHEADTDYAIEGEFEFKATKDIIGLNQVMGWDKEVKLEVQIHTPGFTGNDTVDVRADYQPATSIAGPDWFISGTYYHLGTLQPAGALIPGETLNYKKTFSKRMSFIDQLWHQTRATVNNAEEGFGAGIEDEAAYVFGPTTTPEKIDKEGTLLSSITFEFKD